MMEMDVRDAQRLRLRETDFEFKKLQDFLKGIEITLPSASGKKRQKKIRGLVPSAAEYVFSTEDGRETTVKVCKSYYQTLLHN